MTAEPVRRIRRDADANRTRILEAARSLLDRDGDATMHAIARSAGVGQATLYRNFPSRDALVMTVHRSDVAELVASAPALLEHEDPARALRLWLEKLARYGRIKHGLAGALHTTMHAQLADEGYGPVVGAIETLLAAGRRAGTVRGDITADEVLLLVGFLWRIEPDGSWDERVSRMLDVVMDGLRAT